MRVEREIQKKIDGKLVEIKELGQKLSEAQAAIEAYKEALKLVSRAANVDGGGTLQPGSMVFKAHKLLKQEGRALHVKEIIAKMGEEPTKKYRVSLASSLAGYVRNESIFDRPLPNTFGLIEFGDTVKSTLEKEELPEGFGQ